MNSIAPPSDSPLYAAPAPNLPPTDFAALPDGTRVENMTFVAHDGARSFGLLYRKGGERAVACITHPRGDLTRHYLTPALLEAGYAVCGFTHRFGVNDYNLAHETMLVDIGGVVTALKEKRGFESVVLLANSGGGGIFSFYQWQAETAAPDRFTHTPAGDPLDLNAAPLPPADGLILLATPFGESTVVARGVDPSVTDETDPLSCDASLDMYDPANGYREPPQSSRYDEAFVARYRSAQLARIGRIDAYARSLLAEQRRHQGLMHDPAFASMSVADRSYVRRRAVDTKAVIVYRTDASLAFCDLSLHPSKRSVGTFLAIDTLPPNYMRGMIGSYKSPRAWLSASSPLSSRSSLRQALPQIRVPTLILNYTADRGVYPDDVAEMLELSAASDKALRHVDGDHFGMPIEDASERDPRGAVGRLIAGWLRDRLRGR